MNSIGPPKHPDRPYVAVLGGGKGGSGRSTMCAEIARSLARQGHKVLCVDASWSCPTLNIFLGAPEPPVANHQDPMLGEEGAHLASFIVETSHRNVWLASLSTARAYPFLRPPFQADFILAQLHDLDFDWVLVDLGPELDPFYIGLFVLCDIPLLVCTPEPSAVRIATQFLRSAIFQSISYHPTTSRATQQHLEQWLYDQPLYLNQDTLLGLGDQDPQIAKILDATLDSLEVYLLVNLVREGAEKDLGFVLSHAWFQELGIFPRYLAPVRYEDRRWFYNRRTTGTGNNARQDEALSNDIEKLVRQLTQIGHVDQEYPRPIPLDAENTSVAQTLGLSPSLSTSLVRQHCRRLWEGYRREAIVALVFHDPKERERMAEAIEHIYRSSLSLPGEPAPASTPSSQQISPPPAPPAALPPNIEAVPPLPHEDRAGPSPSSSLDSPGELITRLRKQHQLSLQDLSQRTHIGLKYLLAIEDVDLEVLPRTVYLRGYLREIARIFELEPEPLVQEYFRRLEQWKRLHA